MGQKVTKKRSENYSEDFDYEFSVISKWQVQQEKLLRDFILYHKEGYTKDILKFLKANIYSNSYLLIGLITNLVSQFL